MKVRFRYDLLLVILFLIAWGLKYLSSKRSDEIILDGVHIPRKPCINVINEMYGSAVDSSKMCDCLIPVFYHFVKDNPSQLEKFKQVGLFALSADSNAKFIPVFENCLRQSLLDSNRALQLRGVYLQGLKDKLKQALDSGGTLQNYNTRLVADCLAEKINGHLSMGQYLSPDYLSTSTVKQMIVDCMKSADDKN